MASTPSAPGAFEPVGSPRSTERSRLPTEDDVNAGKNEPELLARELAHSIRQDVACSAGPSHRSMAIPARVFSRSPLDETYIWMYTSYMSKSYTVANARAKLAEIVNEVELGKEVELTRRGRKVAVVISAARYARLRGDRVAFMTAYETFRTGHDLKDVGVDPDWAAALRDRDVGRGVKL